MHTHTLRKLALALTFWLALHSSSLRAQIFTNDLPLQAVTTGSNPVDFEFRADGTLIAKGNAGVGSLLTGDQGAGTRMLWFPSLGAFRAGGIIDMGSGSGYWDVSNIGSYSVAMGMDTTASGNYTTAFGSGSAATGPYATSIGLLNTSSGYGSVAAGRFEISSGPGSTAIGLNNTASGYGATALGAGNAATYNTSTTIGENNWAYGHSSTAFGCGNSSGGTNTTASGYYTQATALDSFVMGTYNVGGGDSNNWILTDPLFEVGNGTSSTPSDALVVYKNGNAVLQGTLQIAPGGDIPMYTGS